MKTKKERPKSQARKNSYRCPACGEMVDNDNWEAVRFHHDHVLRPRPHPLLPALHSAAPEGDTAI
jgi:hypothetical protein